MNKEGFLNGVIRHHRYRPRDHQFDYKMYWTLLDLDNLNTVFRSKLWSVESFNLVSFRDKDYFGKEDNTKQSIIRYIKQKSGKDFSGKIYLFSHLRFLGFNFNSVCFYFCYDGDDIKYIIAEITNTPWGERDSYFLDCRNQKNTDFQKRFYKFEFDKKFHVSPFLSMDMKYRWSFAFVESKLNIHMVALNKSSNDKYFDATFTGEHLPFNSKNQRRIPLIKPSQPLKMIASIYWQALRLWFKRVPFFAHPKTKS